MTYDPIEEALDRRRYTNYKARLKGIEAYNKISKHEADQHAEGLRETVEPLIEAGLSIREACAFLNDHDHYTRTGNPFTVGTTARLLKRLGLKTRYSSATDSLAD